MKSCSSFYFTINLKQIFKLYYFRKTKLIWKNHLKMFAKNLSRALLKKGIYLINSLANHQDY